MSIPGAVRRGFTLMEVTVALAIFATLLALVAQSVMSAARTSDTIRTKSDVMGAATATVNDLSMELRYASISSLSMTSAAGSVAPYQLVTYTFKVPQGLAVSGPVYTGYCGRRVIYDQAGGTVDEDIYDPATLKVDMTKRLASHVILPPPSATSPKNADGTYVYPNGGFTLVLNGDALAVTCAIERSTVDAGTMDLQWESKQSTVFLRSALALGDGIVVTTPAGGGGSGSGAPTPPTVDPPVITSAAAASGANGAYFSYQITATNSPSKFGYSGTLPSGLALNTTNGLISGTPSIPHNQTSYSVTITASNDGGTGSSALALDFTTSNNSGNAPVVTQPATLNAVVGTYFTYQIQATYMTSHDQPIGYAATNLPQGIGVSAASGLISGTPTQAGTYTGTISASNSSGTGSASLTIVVAAPPTPAAPVVTGGNVSATMNSAFSYQVSATNTGPSCAPVAYAVDTLPTGLSLNPGSGLISGTPTAMGVTTSNLTVTNPGGSGSATLTITVGPPSSFAPVVSPGTVAGQTANPLVYNIQATNMDPTMYSGSNGYACSGLPPGLGLNANSGAISGTPTAPGTYTVTATATNNYLSGSNSITFSISSGSTPIPVVTSASVAGQQNAAFSYQISATNMTSAFSPVGYNATNLPAGLIVTTGPSGGLISGTPTVSGTFSIGLSATNGGGTGTGTLTLNVAAYVDPNAPAVTGGNTTATQGSSFTFAISASNMQNKDQPVGYDATGLPAGLSINTSTGVISGTPSASGTFSVAISAQNRAGTGTNTLTIVVSPPAAPSITSTTQSGTVGTGFSYQISATNMGANCGAAGYTATGLPTGLSLDGSTGLITGTPTAQGTSSVTVTARNAGGTGSGTLTIAIAAAPPPVITFNYAQPTNNGHINGSSITAVPPSGYTIAAADVTVNASTTGISYSLSASGVSGEQASFTGNPANGSYVTITATARSTSTGDTVTATSNRLTF